MRQTFVVFVWFRITLTIFCLRFNRKENDLSYQFKLGEYSAHGSRLTCIDPEVKRVRSRGHGVCMSIGLVRFCQLL